MHATIDKITSKPSDYKICMACNYVNWYENEMCVICDSTKLSDDEDMVHKKMVELLDDFEDDMQCELDI